jgi:hypothetical protein
MFITNLLIEAILLFDDKAVIVAERSADNRVQKTLQEAEKDRLNDFAFAIVIGNDISAD